MDPSIKIREAVPEDAAACARVHVDTWRTTYRGIVPDAMLDRPDALAKRTAMWTKTLQGEGVEGKGFTFVALDARGDVLGFSGGGIERGGDPDYKGELYAVYILQAHQGKGIGRCLTRAVASRLLRDGFSSMLVWVLKDNPHRMFYESLGGKPVREKTERIGDKPLVEMAYGWTDLRTVAKCAEKTR